MNIQKVSIKGAEVNIPAYYQRVKSLPDDPPDSCAYAVQTEHASCLVLVRPIQESETVPNEKGKLIAGVRQYLKDNQGLIEVEAGPEYAFSIVKTLKNPDGVFYNLLFEKFTTEPILEVQAQFEENGPTGIRESMVYEYCRKKGIMGTDDDPFAGWTRDPYDETVQTGAIRNYSELQKFDRSFPDFPLSLCRVLLRTIISKK